MAGEAVLTNAVLEGTPIRRSYLRREDVDLPNGRVLIHARGSVAVDRTASAARANFRRVDSDSSARAIDEVEAKTTAQVEAKSRGERGGDEFR